MKKSKITAILLSVVLLGSIGIGVVCYFFAQSIIKKDNNENQIDVNNDKLVNIHQYLDKFELAKITFDIDNFINTNEIKFDQNKIEHHLFSFIFSNLTEHYKEIDKNLINLKIYYQIYNNNLNIISNWKIKYNINSEDFYNEYYDKFRLKIIRKN